MKHTEGPWYYTCGAVWTRPDANTTDPAARCIATRASTKPNVPDIPPTEKDANMRLCAAAPYMLVALRSLIDYADNMDEVSLAECIQDARAAIAKAEGK